MVTEPDRKWLPETPAIELCRMKRQTWTTWADQGIVTRPANGAYGFGDVIRLALVSELRKILPVEDMAAAWRGISADGIADEIVELAGTLREDDRLDLVIEPESGRVVLATDDNALAQAVRHPTAPRPVIVISPAAELCRVAIGFSNRALSTPRPDARRRGRPRVASRPVQEQVD